MINAPPPTIVAYVRHTYVKRARVRQEKKEIRETVFTAVWGNEVLLSQMCNSHSEQLLNNTDRFEAQKSNT